ncbi:MAG: tail fiber domain-containing protein [Janthinobacterium lividum]
MKSIRYILKAFVLLLGLLSVETGFAQNVGISSSSSFVPDASAALDVSYTSKGLLIPRVALTATNVAGPIASPATSLLVYNTATAGTSPNNVIPGYYYYNGSAWIMLTTSTQTTNFWSTIGNSGTSSTTNFLGTTDNKSFRIRTNNTQRFLLDSLGNAAIGSSPTFSSSNMEKLLVDAGTTASTNVISGKGNLNSYLQLNIQNTNAGTTASSDVVATADNGSETANYVDMGINSSANTSASFGAANDAYLYNTGGTVGGNFFIGTNTSGKVLGFLTGGGATTNERMRIDGSGNVGIGTTSPATKLHVFGANPLTLSGVVTGTNTTADSLLTITSGLVRKLPLSTFAPTGSWATTGNAGTSYPSNFLGTTDNNGLHFRTNSIQRAVIDSLGNMGLGSAGFNSSNPEKLLVDAGTTSSTNVISGKGTINSFLQLNIQNLSTGTSASTDVVATADNGTDAVNYVDMGINGSKNNNTFYYGLANDAYLYNVGGSVGGNFYIGTSTSAKILGFLTGGTAATNERMRIDGSGNVGIGTTAPAQKLDVVGSIRTTTGSITVDATATNTGTLSTALLFGSTASGEGISSKRTSGTNQNGIDFYTSSSNRMSITNTGNVGIGTNSPRYPLEIATKIAYTTGTYSAYNNNTDGWSTTDAFSYYANGNSSSTSNASSGGSGTYYSIVTAGRVAAKEFNAYSDKREKIVIGQSDGKADIALLNKLKITDYTWIDKIGKSPVPEKKLIAQELRAVYPQAVKLIPGFIPNVYQKPVSVQFDSTKKIMSLNFLKAHTSSKGDLLRIYVFDKLHEVTIKSVPSPSSLVVEISDILDSTPSAKDIFIFGKKVNDYHTVDYDAVSMLNVSATQELYRQLEQQKDESKKVIDDLKKQLQDQNERIKRLEEKSK